VSDPHEALLEELRPAAFGIAYRMLGSRADAEVERALHGVVEARVADEEVRARGERQGRDPGGEGEREREAAPQPYGMVDPRTVGHGRSKR